MRPDEAARQKTPPAASAAGGAPLEATAPVTGRVHSWDLSTGVDGPGTRFVLFTAGCPLRCLYCETRTPGARTAAPR
jgi:hypothetical protein